MKMKTTKALAALALAASVNSTAIPEAGGIIECILVNAVVDVLKGYPSATPYCSSLLQIPAQATVIPTAVPKITAVTDVITSVVTPPVPDFLASFKGWEITQACSCLEIPTPTLSQCRTVTKTEVRSVTSTTVVTAAPTTVTSTVTKTVTASTGACPAPTACANQGLEWEYLNNTSGNNNDATYSNFFPESYKGKVPIYSGVTNTIGGLNVSTTGQNVAIYGSTKLLWSLNFMLNHRGYIFARQSGVYTFSVSGVDDALFIWVGPNAYSGWTRANANSIVVYHGGPGSGTFKVTLTEGQYYPVRLVFAQGQGAAVFSLTVTAPDGSIFLGPKTQGSPYLVTKSCDGTSAPQYPAWTAEK